VLPLVVRPVLVPPVVPPVVPPLLGCGDCELVVLLWPQAAIPSPAPSQIAAIAGYMTARRLSMPSSRDPRSAPPAKLATKSGAQYKGGMRAAGIGMFNRRPGAGRLPLASLQERLESSRLGRLAISVFVAATVAAIAIVNLPDSKVQRSLLSIDGPYVNALGLDQNWGVFAPDGRESVIVLDARVRYTDGSTAAWRLPEGDPFVTAYWDYRWRKWAENLITAGNDGAAIWRPAAIWIARQETRPGKSPAQVTLAARLYDLLAPGDPRGDHGPWRRTQLYSIRFGGRP